MDTNEPTGTATDAAIHSWPADPCTCEHDRELTEHHDFDIAPAAGGGWVAWAVALGRLLARLAALPTHCVVITQDPDQRYAQMLIGHGAARVEVSSNHYLTGDYRLDLTEEAHVRALGFERPDEPEPEPEPDERFPQNWWVEHDPADAHAIADVVAHALAGVLGFDARWPVRVHVFPAETPCRSCSWMAGA